MPHVAREDLDTSQPSEPLEALEQRGAVHRALERLGDRCRQLLKVLYFENTTPAYAQIAERLQMRIGSIGPTRARCLQRLRDLLEGQLDG